MKIAVVGLLALVPVAAQAVDGVIEINDAAAAAGGVTPGDAPGYPVTLSLPGSYRLTGNLNVPVDTSGVEFTADNVSLDLNGFSILSANCAVVNGARVCSQQLGTFTYGVDGTGVGLQVSNGSVVGFGFGLRLGVAQVRHISALANITGISLGAGHVEASISAYNQSVGFTGGTLITASQAILNGGSGFQFTGTVERSAAISNRGYAMEGVGRVMGCDLTANGELTNNGALAGVIGIGGSVITGIPNHQIPPHLSIGTIQLSPNVCGAALCP